MIAWRISNYADLKGTGGLRVEGRWHSAGRPIVYLADHSASAILEMLVHSELRALPANFQLLKIDIPDNCIFDLDPEALETSWQKQPLHTQSIGDSWLALAPSAVLRVPSALTIDGRNFLLNPIHADATQCQILETITMPLDPRFRPQCS